MIRIVINGIAGRMGREILSVLEARPKFSLIGGIDLKKIEGKDHIQVSQNPMDLLPKTDVVIDFSLPQGALNVLYACLTLQKPLVTGTTGLTEEEIEKFRKAGDKIPVVQAFNFSIGINLLVELVTQAARVLKDKTDTEIVEIHHRMKKDAPSGTALMLAEAIARGRGQEISENITIGRRGKDLSRGSEIGIHSLRGGTVIGEHEVHFFGMNENLTFSHRALNRKIFVDGALTAAEWIVHQKPGYYRMKDVLGF